MQSLSRRNFLRSCAAAAGTLMLPLGCKKNYVRPPGYHDLGRVEGLFYSRLHIRDRSILLYRDDKGWAALSTQCTYEGCNLTVNESQSSIYCSCCRSLYTMIGDVQVGPATESLPWFEIVFKDKHLYAVADKLVPRDYRFNTPELDEMIKQIRATKTESPFNNTRVPHELLGDPVESGKGMMFREVDPLKREESEMIK